MLNIWLIAAGAAAIAAVAAVVRRGRTRGPSLAPPGTAVSPVSSEWLSNARGKEEFHA